MSARLCFLAVLILVAPPTEIARGQTRIDTLRKIYGTIQYQDPTGHAIDAWVVEDRALIGDIVNQLLTNRGLRKEDGSGIDSSDTKMIEAALEDNRVALVCKKRCFDEELASLNAVVEDSPRLAPLDDWVYLSEKLEGAPYNLYERLKRRGYRFTSLAQHKPESSQSNTFDIILDFMNPEIMFWSLPSKQDRRWCISAFGILGNDYLDLPFWFKGTMTVGGKITLIDSTGIARLDGQSKRFSIFVGWEGPVNFRVDNSFSTAMTKARRLIGSSQNIYFGASYVPSFNWPHTTASSNGYLELAFIGSLKIGEKKQNDFPENFPNSFYSVNNSVTVSGKLRHLFFNLFDVGAGISWHSLSFFERPRPDTDAKLDERFSSDHYIPFLEFGVSKAGPLLQYDISAQLNANVSRGERSDPGYGFFAFKSSIMLSNAFGFDFRYFKSLRPADLPPWQYDDYIVFSPVIRINY